MVLLISREISNKATGNYFLFKKSHEISPNAWHCRNRGLGTTPRVTNHTKRPGRTPCFFLKEHRLSLSRRVLCKQGWSLIRPLQKYGAWRFRLDASRVSLQRDHCQHECQHGQTKPSTGHRNLVHWRYCTRRKHNGEACTRGGVLYRWGV